MAAVASAALPPPPEPVQGLNSGSDNEAEECWICLSSAGPLSRPCDCPRVCHRECIATWQLTNYGRREENFCRFCNKRLPALWKPDPAKEAQKEELRIAPVMAVRYNGPEGTREFKLRVRPGPEGLATFKAHLKEILGFDVGPEFDVTFECQMPSTGSMLTLSGLNAYGAATHCAALLAATKSGTSQSATAAAAAPLAAASTPGTAVPSTAAAASAPPQLHHQQQQQQQECIVQHLAPLQRPPTRPLVPAVLLPSEVPSAIVGAAAAAVALSTSADTASSSAASARPLTCGRRVCQTGYLQYGSNAVRQLPSGAGSHGDRRNSALTSSTSYMGRTGGGGRAGLVATRSVGGGCALHSGLRPASDDLIDCDDFSDELLSYGTRQEPPVWQRGTVLGYEGEPLVRRTVRSSGPSARADAAAAQETAGAAAAEETARAVAAALLDVRQEAERPCTSSGAQRTTSGARFGGRVLPVSARGLLYVANGAAAAVAGAPAVSGPCAAAVLAGSASAPVQREEMRRMTPDGSIRGGDDAAAYLAAPSTDSRDDVAAPSGVTTSAVKDLAPVSPRSATLAHPVPAWAAATAAAATATAAGGLVFDSRKGRSAVASLERPQSSHGSAEAAVAAGTGTAGTDGSGPELPRDRLTAAIRQAARHAVDAITRVVLKRQKRKYDTGAGPGRRDVRT